MAYDIGPRIGIEGEKEFRDAIKQAADTMKTLGTEMEVVTSQFAKGDKSIQALTAQNEVLNKQITTQKDKLNDLQKGLAAAAEKYGDNDKVTQEWQRSVNKATADLNNMERQVKDNNAAMDDAGKKAEDAGEKAKKSGDDAKAGGKGWENLRSGLAKVGEVAAKAVAALGAAAVGTATAIGALTVKAGYAADDINTLSKQTGLSTDEIQRFQFASEQIDVPLETLTGSMAKLTKNMATAQKGTGDSAAAFKVLGVQITNADGTLRSNQDVFDETVAALGKINNETQRDAYAMQIFGKSAQDLNPLILGGADALKELGDQAEAAGLILSQESLDKLNAVSDAMDTFKATISGAGNLFSVAFAEPIAAAVNKATEFITRLTSAFSSGGWEGLVTEVGAVLRDVTQNIADALPQIVSFGLEIITSIGGAIMDNLPVIIDSAVQIITTLLNALIGALPQLIDGALQIVTSLASAILDNLPEIIEAGVQVIITLAQGLADSLPELIPKMVDAVILIVETLIDNVDLLIDASIAIIMALAVGLIDALPKLIEKVPVIITKLIEAITTNLPKLIEMGVMLVVELAFGLIKAIPELIKAVPKIIVALANGFMDNAKKMTDIGKNIVLGIWEGIKGMAEWFAQQVKDFFGGIVDGVKKLLGINSPSKVFAGIGENMAAGLGRGFTSSMRDVAKQVQGSIPTTLGNVTVTASGAAGKSGVGAGGIVFNQVINSKVALSPYENATASRNALKRMAWSV